MTVDLRSGRDYVVYVDNFEGDPPCSGSGRAGGTLRITSVPQNSFAFFQGSTLWDARYQIRTSKDDAYRISCGAGGYVGPLGDGTIATESYSVGDKFPSGHLLGNFFGALGALVVLPFLGFVVGAVIGVATLSRRRGHNNARVPLGSSDRPEAIAGIH